MRGGYPSQLGKSIVYVAILFSFVKKRIIEEKKFQWPSCDHDFLTRDYYWLGERMRYLLSLACSIYDLGFHCMRYLFFLG